MIFFAHSWSRGTILAILYPLSFLQKIVYPFFITRPKVMYGRAPLKIGDPPFGSAPLKIENCPAPPFWTNRGNIRYFRGFPINF